MGCRARRGRRKMEGVSEDIVADLRANFEGECSESVCTWPWLASPIARAIPRSACTGRRLPTRRQSMPPSSLSSWARS